MSMVKIHLSDFIVTVNRTLEELVLKQIKKSRTMLG